MYPKLDFIPSAAVLTSFSVQVKGSRATSTSGAGSGAGGRERRGLFRAGAEADCLLAVIVCVLEHALPAEGSASACVSRPLDDLVDGLLSLDVED